ncbi:RagB/SusD family nutrient uptake outer membrane protein [Chitinophaga sp. Cy-1792]|uniref:RagB/SusD family nutrient uptake outer membrane protein n=1 Tax=Chitinophaga sp. Cy-1792 TaxID=2608339 RepID=UPI001421F1D1|nr:RagB/SusD family nutrient uptake outer membrane protein [Chitinophaga sp. Cy-1792]NIG56015.1 RagB/SusD family nutrient uptake outer membrane protein [Chitinophaga sp. Cy-1792]
MKRISIFLLAAAAFSSCKKDLNKQPLDSPSSGSYYTNEAEVSLGLTGVYSSTYWNLSNSIPVQISFDQYTDLGLERAPGIAAGTYDATTGTIGTTWQLIYKTVSYANNLLDGMVRAKGNMLPDNYNRMDAEARVLRAWAYYHLIGLYGDVPFYTKPLLPSEFYNQARVDKNKIGDFLLTDLDSAATKLPWQPADQGRVSRGVALGLKSKLALMLQRYDVAATAANDVIKSAQYSLNPVFANLFKKTGQAANAGKEIMYILPFPDDAVNPVSYVAIGQGSRAISAQSGRFPIQPLVDRFECTDGKRIDQSPLYDPANPSKNRDPRLKQTVTMNGDTISLTASGTLRRCVYSCYNNAAGKAETMFYNFATGTWASASNADMTNIYGPVLNGVGYLWAKYTYDDAQDAFTSKTGFIYMRYAEILLTYAEAKVEGGQLDASVIAAVNQVRQRAGMPVVDAVVAGDLAKMKQLVRREKVVELANEGIHLFDMRRWKTGKTAMNTFVYGAAAKSNVPAAVPSFGGAGSETDLNDIPDYTNSATVRFKREQRYFIDPRDYLWPIPQGERDMNKLLGPNPGW